MATELRVQGSNWSKLEQKIINSRRKKSVQESQSPNIIKYSWHDFEQNQKQKQFKVVEWSQTAERWDGRLAFHCKPCYNCMFLKTMCYFEIKLCLNNILFSN